MEESGPHKQSILRNKEVPKKNAPHKPRDVTRPTVMVKRYGFRGTLAIKYKIYFWNNPITASVLVWNQVVLNQSQQLGYLNSKLMLSWDCPFNSGTMIASWKNTHICTWLSRNTAYMSHFHHSNSIDLGWTIIQPWAGHLSNHIHHFARRIDTFSFQFGTSQLISSPSY